MRRDNREYENRRDERMAASREAYDKMTPLEKKTYDAINDISFTVYGKKGPATYRVRYSMYDRKYHVTTYSDIGFCFFDYENAARQIINQRLKSYGVYGAPITFN